MRFHTFFTLILCFTIFANVNEICAKKRTDQFRRTLKQMKIAFKICLMKLVNLHLDARRPVELSSQSSQSSQSNETSSSQDEDDDENVTMAPQQGALVLRSDVSAEARHELISDLKVELAEKIEKMPHGKIKLQLMAKFKNELESFTSVLPFLINDTTHLDTIMKLRANLIEKVKEELAQIKQQEQMLDPKQRRRIYDEIEKERVTVEIKAIQAQMESELMERKTLQFPKQIANQIWGTKDNTTTFITDLTTLLEELVVSRDMLEEIKRTCREIDRLYEVDVSAIIELSNYLLQNIDVQVDLMTDLVRVMNHQPNLIAGTFEFHFTRTYLDHQVLQKAAAQIYEMTLSFAELRRLHYKCKDRQWCSLANKTSVLFYQINDEMTKQNQKFLITA